MPAKRPYLHNWWMLKIIGPGDEPNRPVRNSAENFGELEPSHNPSGVLTPSPLRCLGASAPPFRLPQPERGLDPFAPPEPEPDDDDDDDGFSRCPRAARPPREGAPQPVGEILARSPDSSPFEGYSGFGLRPVNVITCSPGSNHPGRSGVIG